MEEAVPIRLTASESQQGAPFGFNDSIVEQQSMRDDGIAQVTKTSDFSALAPVRDE